MTVPAGVYGDPTAGDLERAHLYVGHKQPTNSDDPLGQYYHNPGAASTTMSTIIPLATDVRATASGTSITTSAPTLMGTTMDVTVLKKMHPPSIIFGTSGGTQVIITQHPTMFPGDPGGAFYTDPGVGDGPVVYDGTKPQHTATLLNPDGTKKTIDATFTSSSTDQLLDSRSRS